MRTSSRTEILDAALRVVEAAGGAEITYSSVAREVGLSKAGLMYHFPTRDALMIAVAEHVVSRWQRELLVALGGSVEDSSLAERVRAFVEFAGEGGVTEADFVVFTEAIRRPEISGPWLAYLHTWFGFGTDSDTTALLLVWLATNGLWIAEATNIITITPEQRGALISRLAGLLEDHPSL